MARAIWSGVLTFGLVSVPEELYSATAGARKRSKSRTGRASQEGTIQEARREEGAGREEGGHPQASRVAEYVEA
jgi:non-homologous end joining protein Ku